VEVEENFNPMYSAKESLSTRLIATRQDEHPGLIDLIASRAIKPDVVDKVLTANMDVIELKWLDRHAKAVYLIGPAEYQALTDKARKFGRNPKAYMATLINKALSHKVGN
jgi:hypothetical protein